MRAAFITLSSLNAALYAVVGYFTYLGIFAPIVGVVRFWPPVVIPAAFAVAFGPLVGAVGAAIGIFISDMLIHGNAFLSLTVGVPANFICFYLIGYLSRLEARRAVPASIGVQLLPIAAVIILLQAALLDFETALILGGACIVALALSFIVSIVAERWRSYIFAASAGLLVGSLIVGFGVWLFSQFFLLPTGAQNLPLTAAVIWFTWTYSTEIPFLVALAPPLIWALKQAGWRYAS